ncbi:hypothetical protein BDF19DRAFT_265722 [Syncephalis fuscata]|nr:hypothetical protein BDF19DRAFT_265722 [Syncephalis fuscata]
MDTDDNNEYLRETAAAAKAALPRWCHRHHSSMHHWCIDWNDLCIGWADRDLRRTLRSLLYRDQPAMVCTNVSVRARHFANVQLSPGAQRVRDSPNAGGSSILSEILSCELISRWLGAKLLLTEMEVCYFPSGGPMTDYICELGDGLSISVSVTRAMTAPHKTYTRADARRLIRKKLRGVIGATRHIVLSSTTDDNDDDDSTLIHNSAQYGYYQQQNKTCGAIEGQNATLYKQILHIWAPSGRVARMVRQEWRRLEPELIGTTLVVVSIVDQSWVFTNCIE